MPKNTRPSGAGGSKLSSRHSRRLVNAAAAASAAAAAAASAAADAGVGGRSPSRRTNNAGVDGRSPRSPARGAHRGRGRGDRQRGVTQEESSPEPSPAERPSSSPDQSPSSTSNRGIYTGGPSPPPPPRDDAGEQPLPEPSEPSESSVDSLLALYPSCPPSLSPRSSCYWQRQRTQESQWSTYLLTKDKQLDDAAWCVSNGIPPSGLLDDIDYDGTYGKCLVCFTRSLLSLQWSLRLLCVVVVPS